MRVKEKGLPWQGVSAAMTAPALPTLLPPYMSASVFNRSKPEASLRDPHAVSVADFRAKIADDDRDIVGRAPPAKETDDAFLAVRAVDPFESGRLAIAFVQRRHLPVHRIQIAYEPLYSRMERIGKQCQSRLAS